MAPTELVVWGRRPDLEACRTREPVAAAAVARGRRVMAAGGAHLVGPAMLALYRTVGAACPLQPSAEPRREGAGLVDKLQPGAVADEEPAGRDPEGRELAGAWERVAAVPAGGPGRAALGQGGRAHRCLGPDLFAAAAISARRASAPRRVSAATPLARAYASLARPARTRGGASSPACLVVRAPGPAPAAAPVSPRIA